MVDGYFDGNVPMDFWNLLALYISNNTLSSLPWAVPFGQHEIDVMVNQSNDILEWYDGMRNPVPNWYDTGGRSLMQGLSSNCLDIIFFCHYNVECSTL